MNPDYLDHRKRVRKKYLKNGIDGWHDYEVLEFLLFFAVSRKDTKPISKELLKKFKTLGGVLDASSDELRKVKGIGKNAASLMKLVREVTSLYLKRKVEGRAVFPSPGAVYDYLKVSMQGLRDEVFKVIYLDASNRFIESEIMSRGVVNKAAVYPRKIVENALKKNAVSVIISHNHPSGKLVPSNDDRRMTKMVSDALAVINIAVVDHVIVSSEGYFSFKENGLI
ncbi:MAG: DNA repair protein RadC [Candidatus Aureabacteria bacterium]|nr:DNA repair protein RadC [Candidatus Auribacterota bacterium]